VPGMPFGDGRLDFRILFVQADVMSMPVGYKQTDTSIRVRAAETAVTPDLASCLCGVSFATALADVPNTNVAGFVLMYVVCIVCVRWHSLRQAGSHTFSRVAVGVSLPGPHEHTVKAWIWSPVQWKHCFQAQSRCRQRFSFAVP
jgi:hypothetical protein